MLYSNMKLFVETQLFIEFRD